ncbi:MAG: translation factor [Chitinophagaceae bacterium]|nr:translation factor [Chitinophagaceae bacterium]
MDFETDILNCIAVLKSGGIILYPTDTIWGIGCDATNEKAVEKIFALKKRSDEKSMIILAADNKEVLRYVASLDLNIFDYLAKTTKPTTVIYDHAIGVADNLIGKDGSIAIRICSDEFCRHLIKRFRKPIVSTSANISGQTSPTTFSGIGAAIKEGVDYIVKHRQHDTTIAEPSSIIKWNKDSSITIIRP